MSLFLNMLLACSAIIAASLATVAALRWASPGIQRVAEIYAMCLPVVGLCVLVFFTGLAILSQAQQGVL